MGRTFGFEAAPGTIRGDFGVSKTLNLVHGSDAPESAESEIALYFGPGIKDYLEFRGSLLSLIFLGLFVLLPLVFFILALFFLLLLLLSFGITLFEFLLLLLLILVCLAVFRRLF